MILSVSRRTDIPNYFSEWFFNRIKEGFLYVRNPINVHQISRIDISPDVVDCIVFWTKNPANMLKKLYELKDYKYYFQFTITGYGKDIEPRLCNKADEIISTFKKLSELIGREKVIWRYDPILLNSKYTMEYHLRAFEKIADSLKGYTDRVVISFVDLYAKTLRNMSHLELLSIDDNTMIEIAKKMHSIAEKNNFAIETCAENIELRDVGVTHGSCIDKDLIERIIGCKLKVGKDKNQRVECGCIESIDVGTYNTCANCCKYCYANYSNERVINNMKLYDANSPLLCSKIDDRDKINERKVNSLKVNQISLWR